MTLFLGEGACMWDPGQGGGVGSGLDLSVAYPTAEQQHEKPQHGW